jgi:hypothetical protein
MQLSCQDRRRYPTGYKLLVLQHNHNASGASPAPACCAADTHCCSHTDRSRGRGALESRLRADAELWVKTTQTIVFAPKTIYCDRRPSFLRRRHLHCGEDHLLCEENHALCGKTMVPKPEKTLPWISRRSESHQTSCSKARSAPRIA